jgi:hypothetical protein
LKVQADDQSDAESKSFEGDDEGNQLGSVHSLSILFSGLILARASAENSLLNKMLRSELVNCQSDLEIMRKDPNSPLYSVKSFEALHLFVSVTIFPFSILFKILLISRKPELLKGVYGMGFNAPSKIQETALPTLLADP